MDQNQTSHNTNCKECDHSCQEVICNPWYTRWSDFRQWHCFSAVLFQEFLPNMGFSTQLALPDTLKPMERLWGLLRDYSRSMMTLTPHIQIYSLPLQTGLSPSDLRGLWTQLLVLAKTLAPRELHKKWKKKRSTGPTKGKALTNHIKQSNIHTWQMVIQYESKTRMA